jgi:hypothetical protein
VPNITPRRAAAIASLAVVVALALGGCVAETAPAPPAAPSAVADPGTTPTLVPGGDAAANLAYFDAINRELLAEVATPDGRQLIDNLEAAGFAKTDMELTPDTTVGDEPAGNIQFSVRTGGSCLVAQNGTAGYNAVAAPLLGTGKCLVGATRSIDW